MVTPSPFGDIWSGMVTLSPSGHIWSGMVILRGPVAKSNTDIASTRPVGFALGKKVAKSILGKTLAICKSKLQTLSSLHFKVILS